MTLVECRYLIDILGAHSSLAAHITPTKSSTTVKSIMHQSSKSLQPQTPPLNRQSPGVEGSVPASHSRRPEPALVVKCEIPSGSLGRLVA